MTLRREISKIEVVEEQQEQEELAEEIIQAELRGIDEKLIGLYRRIDVIIEYIDNLKTNDTTITEQQLKEDEQHFKDIARGEALELKNLELNSKIRELTKSFKEQKDSTALTK